MLTIERLSSAECLQMQILPLADVKSDCRGRDSPVAEAVQDAAAAATSHSAL